MPVLTPAFALTVVLVLLSATAVHAATGRTARGLAIILLAALGGFAAGEAIARALSQHRAMVGTVHMGHGLLGTWLAMIVARRRAA